MSVIGPIRRRAHFRVEIRRQSWLDRLFIGKRLNVGKQGTVVYVERVDFSKDLLCMVFFREGEKFYSYFTYALRVL